MTITGIEVVSLAKIMGILYALLGLLAGGMFSLMSLAGFMAAGDAGPEALLFGAGAVVLLPCLYGVMGFVGGAISAVIYNVSASIVGGIELQVDYHNLPYPTGSDGSESPFITD